MGAVMDIRAIDNEEPGMSPKEIWSNEAQERYVLAIEQKHLKIFTEICKKERCPFAVIGKTTKRKNLTIKDSLLKKDVVNMSLDVLLGNPPKLSKNIETPSRVTKKKINNYEGEVLDTITQVLKYPSVSSKSFLITIGDRSVTGLVARDQMIGAVASSSFQCRCYKKYI